jgi:D-alanyl-D-alanine carboxypeptidase (penicillin-binding protein 5/6)
MVREDGIAFPPCFSYLVGKLQRRHDTFLRPVLQSARHSGKSERQVQKPVLFAILPTVRTQGFRTSPMAADLPNSRKAGATAALPWRSLLAAVLAIAVGWGGIVYAANNSVQGGKKEEGGFDGDAPTAILIEASSGSVLFEKNADELRAPSSMMKLMTAEVVFNAVKKGDVKLTDEYRISENAWRKGGAPAGGSTMFAILNSKVSVDDLLKGAIIQSGNDSCIALAEGMAGNERIFAADFLTKRARELGMTKSTFGNSSGLPDPANKMTVRELGKLARHLILTYPDMYKLFGEREFTWNKIRQQNRNPLLNSLNGADGLKTGYTKEGGYGMVGSAVQNDTRLIVVVNGMEDPDDRASEAKKMLEWGFRNFETRTLFAANQPVGYAKVFGGESRSVKLASPEPIKVMVPKNGNEKLIARIVYNGPVRAPVQPGQAVGVVKVWRGQNIAVETPVYAAEAVGTGSTMRRAIDGASELVIGMFRASAAKL